MNNTHNLIQVIRSGKFVILDTETTGLERGEIVQIAVIDSSGQVLMDQYIKPVNPIPPSVTAIHGITDAMVATAQPFSAVVPELLKILTDQNVIVYNAVYDRKMLHQSAEACGHPKTEWRELSHWWCAMEVFAEVYGDWNSYRQSYRWQKLTTAARYYNLPILNAHSALGDCQMTLGVCRAMAAAVK